MQELVERFEEGPIREAMSGALERRLSRDPRLDPGSDRFRSGAAGRRGGSSRARRSRPSSTSGSTVLRVVVERPAAAVALARLQARPGALGDRRVDRGDDAAERGVDAVRRWLQACRRRPAPGAGPRGAPRRRPSRSRRGPRACPRGPRRARGSPRAARARARDRRRPPARRVEQPAGDQPVAQAGGVGEQLRARPLGRACSRTAARAAARPAPVRGRLVRRLIPSKLISRYDAAE